MARFLKKNAGLILVFLLSLGAIVLLLQPGFFPMHDDTQVVRVFQMNQALRDGHFPVRWVKDLGYGYGYPLFNFYSPFPYYIGGLINLAGLNALDATKIMMILGVLLSGILMYLLAREFWGEVGGIISGLSYIYAPYHAVDIYVRGAVGEFWAIAFLPLMAWGFYKVAVEPSWRWVVVGALGYTGIILSHNLTAMMVTPFLIIATLLYSYITYKSKKLFTIYYLLFTILLGLGISAFYWMPALLEIQYTNVLSQIGGGANFRDHFVCWQQLWNSPWGFGGSIPGCIDGMSFKIGKLHLITTFLVLVIGSYFWKKDRARSVIILSSIFYLLFSIAMTLEISKPIWETIPALAFIQYPWRFLLLVSFLSSFLVGAIIWFLRYFNTVPYFSFLMGAVFIFLLFFFNLKLFQPQTILSKFSNDYTNEENIKWTTSKISDEYMPRGFIKPQKKEEIVRERVMGADLISDKTQELSFMVNNREEKNFLIKIAPFPAWRAFIDGNPVSYLPRNNGLEVQVSQGKHEVRFSFISTPLEKLANMISIISLLGLIGGIVYFRLRR